LITPPLWVGRRSAVLTPSGAFAALRRLKRSFGRVLWNEGLNQVRAIRHK